MSIKRFPTDLEYKRDPKLKKESVEQLLEWTLKQPHLPCIAEEDAILFLSSCYYSMELAKRTIEEYYTFRTHVPEFFHNRNPLEPQSAAALKAACYVKLPGLTDEGYQVFYCRLMEFEVSKFNFPNKAKCLFYHTDITLIEEGASKGLCVVFDLKNVSFGHVARISPLSVKKLLYYVQEAMPVKLRNLNFVNSGPVIDILLSMMKPFLNKTTAENLFVHSTWEDLYKVIPKKILPKDVGGNNPSLSELHAESVIKVITNADWLISEEKQRVQESLRPGKAKTAGDLFGVEGSFKKLDID